MPRGAFREPGRRKRASPCREAEQRRGLADAVVALSDIYLFGEGVGQDPERAISLLSDAR